MTSATATHSRRAVLPAPVLALGGAAALAAAALLALPEMLKGFLAGWIVVLGVCVGAAVLIHIHAITRGRWRSAGEPHLTALAGATPTLALGGLVLLLAGKIYPWAGAADPVGPAVEDFYLNTPFFLIRAAVALGFWSLFGVLASSRAPSPLRSGLLLAGHGIVLTIAGFDWVLSLDPGFTSTDFGALLGITQLGSALALAALFGLDDGSGDGTTKGVGDWGALLLATMLGVAYLAAMQYLVIWSGDIPDKAEWYLDRIEGVGAWLAGLSFLFGVLLPVALMIPTKSRGNRGTLRMAGALVLVGISLHSVFLVAASPIALLAWAGALALGAAVLPVRGVRR